MMPPEPTDSPTLGALTGLLRGAVKKPSQAELDRGLFAFRARIAGSGASRFERRRWVVLVAVALPLVLVAAVFVPRLRSDASVSERPASVSRVEGGRLLSGGYLSESGHAGIKLFFDEGSRFELTPGARGRLRVGAEKGASLALEHGAVALRITPSRERRWAVEAGPFLVRVKGTDFTVEWDPASEELELTLRRGRVVVSGPVVGDGFALRPGQKLTVSLPKAQTVITEEPPTPLAVRSTAPFAPAPSASSSSATVPPDEPKRSDKPEAAGATSGATTERRWREALASGKWDHILADVERDGVQATLETASSDDLFSLANAARYRRRTDLARAALLAELRRFPGSPRSVDAIFLLGRVEELRDVSRTVAIARYDEYLAHAPTGTYAAEALGRKMTLSNELGGPSIARPIAEEYLRRFPDGSYAGAARALLRLP